MSTKHRFFYLFIFSFFFCNCSNKITKNKELPTVIQPNFLDDGKTLNNLKKNYFAESIDFRNWDNRKNTDSCLTVCLLNSTKIPNENNIDENVKHFVKIASSIKNALVNPQDFKTYYIIFLTKVNLGREDVFVHSAGMEIRSADL